ncbi:MAG TPA: serine/threonine-protein kinase [Hyalangium sp.]|nr:serine/threonine-protein kinase [Hyalangium sp.]
MSEDNKTHLSDGSGAASQPAAPLQLGPGTVLKGTYRIEAELGSGGMGTVYRATHIGLDKTMAVKVLSHRAISTPDSLARFEREAKVAGKVSHPAMTDVIDFGVEGGTPYIVMEYVSGVELAELLDRQGTLTPRRAVAVMRQIVSLLRAAHALGIVHRDLKPANIKIIQETPEDSQIFVKVLDFGVAKVVGDVSGQLTSEGMLVGTPAYMAPEQITGQPIDGRTDLYAAGLIFYEMLSGKRAFKGETIARILHAQMNEPPPPLTTPVPDIVRQTLQKFVEKRPEDRFQDAGEADRALMACEDVLRPPSVNLTAGAVVPASEPQDVGTQTVEYRPKSAEAEPSGEAATPGGKPSSAVSVSPSLVREGKAVRQEPALVPAPATPPAPVPASPSAPVPASLSHTNVDPRRSSGSGKAVALVGVALVLIVAGIVGGVWAFKGGRLSGSEAGTEPPKSEPSASSTGATASPGANAPTQPSGEQQGTAPTEPVAETDAPVADSQNLSDNQTTEQPEPPTEPEGTPQEPQDTSPPSEQLEPGCYAAVVAFESSRQADGKFEPWRPKSVNSRTSVKCSAVPRQANIQQSQGLFENWPDSSWGKPLHYAPQLFEPKKKGEPNTRRMVVKVHTRVSESAP